MGHPRHTRLRILGRRPPPRNHRTRSRCRHDRLDLQRDPTPAHQHDYARTHLETSDPMVPMASPTSSHHQTPPLPAPTRTHSTKPELITGVLGSSCEVVPPALNRDPTCLELTGCGNHTVGHLLETAHRSSWSHAMSMLDGKRLTHTKKQSPTRSLMLLVEDRFLFVREGGLEPPRPLIGH